MNLGAAFARKFGEVEMEPCEWYGEAKDLPNTAPGFYDRFCDTLELLNMFGATVLVPTLTGLDVGTTLLFAGLGTLLFHLLAKGKVPAFLGSSFAFLAGYFAIAPNKEPELLPYASFGVACAGLVYVLLAALFKLFGSKKVMSYWV